MSVSASRNRSITLKDDEVKKYSKLFYTLSKNTNKKDLLNKVIHQNSEEAIKYFPEKFVDLLFLDPPYNLTKKFNTNNFAKTSIENYTNWLDKIFSKLLKTLKPTASVYVCGDWLSSTSIHLVLNKYLKVRNRITWEREKGRGAKKNWKNSSEDIWFATVSDDFYFDVDAVKLKRKVIAPYKINGKPKDWENNSEGKFRLTHPSNIWTDITVPFWSMPENTEHPTQKPEKLMAKLILASSKKGDVVFDPFLGSGTTAATAKKLNRNFVGIEIDKKYAAYSLKRIELAEKENSIQGFKDDVFWERNSLKFQR